MPNVNVGDRTQRVTITEDVAERIYRVLVKYASADPTQRIAFVQTMAETGLGRDQEWWELKNARFGVTKFYMYSDEWLVTPALDDESDPTRNTVDTTNLELAKLRDIIEAEQNP